MLSSKQEEHLFFIKVSLVSGGLYPWQNWGWTLWLHKQIWTLAHCLPDNVKICLISGYNCASLLNNFAQVSRGYECSVEDIPAMSRSVVISIKTLLRAGRSLLQQHWNLTLSCTISGLHKVDALICSNLLIMQISAGQQFMQPRSNNIFSAEGHPARPVLSSGVQLDVDSLLTVASFSSSANVWRLLIRRTSACVRLN